MLTKAQIEEKAKEIYLAKYGEMGGRWELVDTKDVWRKMAVDWFNADEGTRQRRLKRQDNKWAKS